MQRENRRRRTVFPNSSRKNSSRRSAAPSQTIETRNIPRLPLVFAHFRNERPELIGIRNYLILLLPSHIFVVFYRSFVQHMQGRWECCPNLDFWLQPKIKVNRTARFIPKISPCIKIIVAASNQLIIQFNCLNCVCLLLGVRSRLMGLVLVVSSLKEVRV